MKSMLLRWWCHHISTRHHYVISFLSTFTHCSSYHYSYTWVQFYQYITTVMLFTRTQSSTLGPRCVISCSDLFTYLPSLWHSVLGDSSIIISSSSQHSLLLCCYICKHWGLHISTNINRLEVILGSFWEV